MPVKNHQTFKAPTISMSQRMAYKMHVLLVDHDTSHRSPTIELLEYFSYKVTTAKNASTALSILSNEKRHTFDLLIENINSFDSCGVKLLQSAVDMDLPAILMLDHDDVVLTWRALEVGAFLCIKKPLSVDIAKYLWQYALWEKMRNCKDNEQVGELETYNGWHDGFGEEVRMKGYTSDNNNLDESYKPRKKARCPKVASHDEESGLQEHGIVEFPKKVWTEWTLELHEKFMNAIRKLGEGRCYPKDILELMNVPGLTRMQVASHLQKCRRGTWQITKERKSKIAIPMRAFQETSSQAKAKRFGIMPQLGINSLSNIQENHENTHNQCFSLYSSTGENVLGDDKKWCSNEGYRSHLCIEPHDSSGYNPFSRADIEALNMDDVFMSAEQFVIDAQSVTASSTYFEIPNMDFMSQTFSASHQQEPKMNYNGRQKELDFDQLYSNDQFPVIPVIQGTVMGQWSKAPKSENDSETQSTKRED